MSINAPSDPDCVQLTEQARAPAPPAAPQLTPDGEQLRVVVVDDHPYFRRAVSAALVQRGFSVPAQAERGAQAVAATLTHRPHVVLMDQRLPDLTGAEATRRILADAPQTRVIALSAQGGEEDVYDALAAGSVGYVLKSASPDAVAAAVRAAAAGHTPLSPAVARPLLEHFVRAAAVLHEPAAGIAAQRLSARERQILALLAAGHDNRAIAAALFVSPHTVKGHVSEILGKLGVANRVQAAVYAARHGLD
jgi:DNA-binding NarL/FixJ family response regulator